MCRYSKSLLFFAPRPRIGFGFPESAAFFTKLEYLILNQLRQRRLFREHRAILLEHSDAVRSPGCERSTDAIKAVRLRALRRLLL
jgi:hypothetical protein